MFYRYDNERDICYYGVNEISYKIYNIFMKHSYKCLNVILWRTIAMEFLGNI